MRQSLVIASVTAAVGTLFSNTYNQYLKPSLEDQPSRMETSVDKIQPATDENCTMPIFKNGQYENPWNSWQRPSVVEFLCMRLKTTNESNVPSKKELDMTLPIEKPDIHKFDNSPSSGVRMMWIGHATVVAQLDGYTVITDPVFSDRASPSQWFGPKRYREPPCRVEELPEINAVLISHNHYDHLDLDSVVALNRRFGKKLQWFVPKGLKGWMTDTGCENVIEMTWWEEHSVMERDRLKVVCTPCKHWCKRNLGDDNKVLWSSWCVLGPQNSFHFAGDTGYCEGFKQIGQKYGPFTAAAIPIGAYHPRCYMGPQHVDPKEAVKIHQDIKSKCSLGIHWGTFVLTTEFYLEPKNLLAESLEELKINPSEFITINHGAIEIFGGGNENK